MSRILAKPGRSVLMLVALTVVLAPPSRSQTLGELADAQRAKQQIEMLKIRKDLEAAELADKLKAAPATSGPQVATADKKPAQAPAQRIPPRVVLYALYTRDDVWVAELASEQRLTLALPGMRIHGQRVDAVEQRGLVVSKPCTAALVRARDRCGERVVRVGEAI